MDNVDTSKRWYAAARSSAAEIRYVRKLARRLPRHSPARLLAQALLDGTFHPIDDLKPLLSILQDPRVGYWRERIVAAWALGEARLDPRQKTQVARSLTDVLENRLLTDWADTDGRYGHWFARTVAAGFVLALVSVTLSGDMAADDRLQRLFAAFIGGSMALALPMGMLSGAVEDRRLNRVRAMAAAALGRLELPETVDALTAAVYDSEGGRETLGCRAVRRAATAALPATLATLTTEHYGAVKAATIPALCRMLSHPDDDLVLAVLNALARVGDGRAVPPVERVAARGRTEMLREAARRVLPVLQERRQRERDAARLLRAADAPHTPDDVLLRPAQSAGRTDPDLLLRGVLQDDWENER